MSEKCIKLPEEKIMCDGCHLVVLCILTIEIILYCNNQFLKHTDNSSIAFSYHY